jgi:hypothetical protein
MLGFHVLTISQSLCTSSLGRPVLKETVQRVCLLSKLRKLLLHSLAGISDIYCQPASISPLGRPVLKGTIQQDFLKLFLIMKIQTTTALKGQSSGNYKFLFYTKPCHFLTFPFAQLCREFQISTVS